MRGLYVALLTAGCGFELRPATGDGEVDAPAGEGGSTACVEAEFPRCAGEDLEICAAGQTMLTDCGYGCVGPVPARCGDPKPSNAVDPAWIPPAPFGGGLMVTGTQIIVADTDSGEIRACGGLVVRAPGTGTISGIDFRRVTSGGLDHGVFALDSLSITIGGTLRLIGDVPVVVLAKGPVLVDGTIDLSGGSLACSFATACGVPGDRRCSGPGPGLGGGDSADGAGTGRGGRGNASSGTGAQHGGGGGGFGAIGGRGGGLDGGSFGIVYGTPTLTPLLAGSGGGGGRSGGSITLYGGGGGGGLQLTSLGSMSINGTIKASGAGGGLGGSQFGHGGGGGGSGGAILLEATSLMITGSVTANGGGGGAGNAPSTVAANGEDGRGDGMEALGGTGTGALAGGAGGALTEPTGRRGLPDTSTPTDGSGGGGGGVGRIYLRSRDDGIVITGATLSPMPAARGSDFLQ